MQNISSKIIVENQGLIKFIFENNLFLEIFQFFNIEHHTENIFLFTFLLLVAFYLITGYFFRKFLIPAIGILGTYVFKIIFSYYAAYPTLLKTPFIIKAKEPLIDPLINFDFINSSLMAFVDYETLKSSLAVFAIVGGTWGLKKLYEYWNTLTTLQLSLDKTNAAVTEVIESGKRNDANLNDLRNLITTTKDTQVMASETVIESAKAVLTNTKALEALTEKVNNMSTIQNAQATQIANLNINYSSVVQTAAKYDAAGLNQISSVLKLLFKNALEQNTVTANLIQALSVYELNNKASPYKSALIEAKSVISEQQKSLIFESQNINKTLRKFE